MKRFLVVMLCIFALGTLTVCATEKNAIVVNQKEKQELISKIGFRILNANKIKQRMVFVYESKKTINATTHYIDRKIVFYEGLLNFTSDEDQIAAVLAHEISHGIDYYDGIMRGYFSWVPSTILPRKYERKADKRAIDFLVNAGYNPVAMIVIMNKTFPQYRYEFLSSHPITSRRMAYVYEHIYYNYPQFLKNNKYYDNIYYQNFLLNSQDNRRKLQNKVERHSREMVKYD